jgi:hypothetical protein
MTLPANVIPKSTVAKDHNKRALPKNHEVHSVELEIRKKKGEIPASEAKRQRFEDSIPQHQG